MGKRTLSATAQESDESSVVIDASLDAGDYPVAPAFVSLLRITLEPEASSPLHTHPGPEIVVVERGTLTVQVGGAAELMLADEQADAGTPVSGSLAPVDSEFEMTAGDQLIYLPQTAMTFRNAGSEPVSLLTVVLLPAGHQHPPGRTFVNGQPDADAFVGVIPLILGNGVASSMPANGIRIVVDELNGRTRRDRFQPHRTRRCLRSWEAGSISPSSAGKCRLSRGATPGYQPDTAPGTETNLAVSDALFAPLGLKEAPRPETDGPISFLRLTIEPLNPEDEPTPSGEGMGEIQVTGTEVTPEPENETPAAGTPAADSTSTPSRRRLRRRPTRPAARRKAIRLPSIRTASIFALAPAPIAKS